LSFTFFSKRTIINARLLLFSFLAFSSPFSSSPFFLEQSFCRGESFGRSLVEEEKVLYRENDVLASFEEALQCTKNCYTLPV
jgi:hypothetical protein